ncbi:hypothetical protein D6779_10830 [Candidatus Parcubacteria bacterium]|nr:MAG: hypothetical protein D6779_10830 [Candidatus Parcubacteria bacterium]
MGSNLTKHQIFLFSKNIPPSMIAVLIGIIVMDLAMLGVVPDERLILWNGVAAGVFLFRWLSYVRLRKGDSTQHKALMFVSATLTGVVWGLATLLFAPYADLVHLTFLAFL